LGAKTGEGIFYFLFIREGEENNGRIEDNNG
jgi:hypothetical protein